MWENFCILNYQHQTIEVKILLYLELLLCRFTFRLNKDIFMIVTLITNATHLTAINCILYFLNHSFWL